MDGEMTASADSNLKLRNLCSDNINLTIKIDSQLKQSVVLIISNHELHFVV